MLICVLEKHLDRNPIKICFFNMAKSCGTETQDRTRLNIYNFIISSVILQDMKNHI